MCVGTFGHRSYQIYAGVMESTPSVNCLPGFPHDLLLVSVNPAAVKGMKQRLGGQAARCRLVEDKQMAPEEGVCDDIT